MSFKFIVYIVIDKGYNLVSMYNIYMYLVNVNEM